MLFALAVAGFISIVRCPKHPSQDPEPAANTKSLSSRRSSSRTRSRKLEFLVLLIRDIAARALGNDGRWLSPSLEPVLLDCPRPAVHAKALFGFRAGTAGCAIASWWPGVAVVLLSLPSTSWSVLWKMA